MASAPSGAAKPAPTLCARKARYVLGEMERRLAAFGLGWADTTATQVYTVHDLYPFLADEIVRRGAAHSGLTWHYARPPVRELEVRNGLPRGRRGKRGLTRYSCQLGLFQVLASFDPVHQPFELIRWFGAKIGVVHAAQFLGDCEQRLGTQANDVVTIFFVVGQRHSASAYLRTHDPSRRRA